MFAATLTVGLSGDSCIATVFAADAPAGKNDVDRPKDILNPVRTVLDPAGMHQETALRSAPPLRGLANLWLGNACHLRGFRGRPLFDVFSDLIKAYRMLVDEVAVYPMILDHQMQNPCEERGITPRLNGQKQIAGAGDRRDPWIDHDDLCPHFPRLPDIIGGNGRALGNVRAADPHYVSAHDVTPRIGGTIDAKRLLVARPRTHHAQSAVVIDEGRL
jgi:hypothetical protein